MEKIIRGNVAYDSIVPVFILLILMPVAME